MGHWTRRCWRGLLLLPALLPAAAHGQSPEKETRVQYQAWWSLNSTWRLSDRWGAVGDFHVRRNDFLAEPSFDLLRFGDDADVSFEIQGGAQADAGEKVIVHDKDTNRAVM